MSINVYILKKQNVIVQNEPTKEEAEQNAEKKEEWRNYNKRITKSARKEGWRWERNDQSTKIAGRTTERIAAQENKK